MKRVIADTTQLRGVLKSAGFAETAEYGTFYNNSRTRQQQEAPGRNITGRTLKVCDADEIVDASNAQKWALVNAVRTTFGDRLVRCGLKVSRGSDFRGSYTYNSYLVVLKD